MQTHESEDATPVADQGDASTLRRDSLPGDARGDGELLSGPVHTVGARSDGAPVGGGSPVGARAAVPRDRGADGRLDDDRDARGALAPARGGRLPHSPRSSGFLRPRPRETTGKLRVPVPARWAGGLGRGGGAAGGGGGEGGCTRRVGLADAIVGLVSSGNTLRTNGLRWIAVLLESEAVLVARDEERAAPLVGMLRAVVEARQHRYLMLNAPKRALPAIAELVSPRVPSVLPLAEAGRGAVHAPVPPADVWRVPPELAAGRRPSAPPRPPPRGAPPGPRARRSRP